MKKQPTGFVLPVVVISGMVLLIILAYSLQTVSVSRETLNNQHIRLLARQAAESGLARVQQCMRDDKDNIRWNASNPIMPNTDCRGIAKSGFSRFVMESSSYRTSFEVRPSAIQDESRNASAIGKIEILADNGSGGKKVLRSYNYTVSAYIKTDVTFDDVTFGSLYVGSGFNDLYNRCERLPYNHPDCQQSGFSKSVYFFTKTYSGKISSVGYNMDGILTGYRDNNVIRWSQRAISDPKFQYESPYGLPHPVLNNTVAIRKIFTDFQGNGWVAFFLGSDGRTVYGTGSNINCDLGTGFCDGAQNGRASRPIWKTGESKMDVSNIPPNEKIIDIKYNSSTFVLTNAGKLYFSGTFSLSPGGGRTASRYSKKPELVTGGGIETKKINNIYTDSYYNIHNGTIAVATTEDGSLYAWGQGRSASNLNLNQAPKKILEPGYSKEVCNQYFIYSNNNAVCRGHARHVAGNIISAITDGGTIWALDDNGLVWSVGDNRYGQLGLGEYYSNRSSMPSFMPISISGDKIIKVAADGFSVLFMTETGVVYGAGLNSRSHLGFSKDTQTCYFGNGFRAPCSHRPRRYNLPAGKLAKDIFIVSPATRHDGLYGGENYQIEAENYRNSFVITKEGEVYGAGSNYHGQLGVGYACAGEVGYSGRSPEFNTPQKMKLDYKQNASGVAGDEDKIVRANYVRSGIGTTIVITDLNRIFTVGNNSNGQLGSGDTKECHIPKRHRYTNVFETWYY